MPADSTTTTVVIAVLTYRRPGDLAEGLPLVLDQAAALNAESGGTFAARVLIVDNDAAGSARHMVDSIRAGLPHERMLDYVIEPIPPR